MFHSPRLIQKVMGANRWVQLDFTITQVWCRFHYAEYRFKGFEIRVLIGASGCSLPRHQYSTITRETKITPKKIAEANNTPMALRNFLLAKYMGEKGVDEPQDEGPNPLFVVSLRGGQRHSKW